MGLELCCLAGIIHTSIKKGGNFKIITGSAGSSLGCTTGLAADQRMGSSDYNNCFADTHCSY